MPFLPPNEQRQSTEGNIYINQLLSKIFSACGEHLVIVILTLSGSVMTMLSPGTREPRSMPSLTTAVLVDTVKRGGLLLGSWTIAVAFVDVATCVF